MNSSKQLVCAILLVLPLTACKKSAPAVAPVKPIKPVYPDISHLTDEQLAEANQADGIGMGLRIPGGSFSANQEVPLHLVIEDFDAAVPIASGLCEGVYVSYEDTDTHDSGGTDLAANLHCFGGADPYPDSVPLAKNKPKTFDLVLQRNGHVDLQPGSYLIEIQWKALPVGPPTISAPTPYTTVHSNRVHIVVTPATAPPPTPAGPAPLY
jgi:hypothetical protein